MSAGPHTTSVLAALEEMRRRYAEMPAPEAIEDFYSRALTLAVHEAIMPMLAASRDAGQPDEQFAQGATHALGNVLASLASCFHSGAEGQALAAGALLLGRATAHRAVQRALDPTREGVVWFGDLAAILRGQQ